MTARNLGEMMRETSEKHPDKVGIEFGPEKLPFRELNARVNRLANALRHLGVKKGDRVCLYLPNGLEFIYAHLANQKIGATTIPLNIRTPERELAWILADSEPEAIITTDAKVSMTQKVRSQFPKLRHQISTGGTSENVQSWGELMNHSSDEEPRVEIEPDDLAVLMYTSGTTGRPKGAMLTHNNFLSNIRSLSQVWQWTPEDRFLLSLPLFHQHGLGVGLHGFIYTGCQVILLESFKAEDVLNQLQERKCTLFMGVPTMYIRFLEIDEPKRFDLSGMRLFISGSAPLPREVFHRFRRTFGFEILERYGMTETMMNASNPYQKARKPGSVGLPLPGVEIAVVDDGGNEVPHGKVGEILVKGPNVFRGYWKNPQANQETFRDGWFKTKDLGRWDHQGYLHIVGRKRDMIITSGFKVYPREVEEVINSHPYVSESAVLGIPDAEKGEKVVGWVVLKNGMNCPKEDLINYCRQNLIFYKIPKDIKFLEFLPKTPSGKVRVQELSRAWKE